MNQVEYEKLIHEQFKVLFDLDLKLIENDKKKQSQYGTMITAVDVGIKIKYDSQVENIGKLYLEVKENGQDTILVKKTKCSVWVQGNENYFWYINRSDIVNWLNNNWKNLKKSKDYIKTKDSEGILIDIEKYEKLGARKYKTKLNK